MKSYYGGPIETHQRYFKRYHPDALRPPLPQDWGSQPQPKTTIAIISGTRVKLYGLQIWPIHSLSPSEQKPVTNLGEKGAWAYPGTAQIFGVPILSHVTDVAYVFYPGAVGYAPKGHGRTL